MYIDYNGTICIESKFLYEEAKLISYGYYKKLRSSEKLILSRKPCKGTPALIDFCGIQVQWIKDKIEQLLGDPYDQIKNNLLSDLIKPDYRAQQFYADYLIEDGRSLPGTAQKTYRANAEVLNAINQYIQTLKGYRRSRSGRVKIDWKKIANAVINLNTKMYPHKLPTNHRRLAKKYQSYTKNGYIDLVHKGYLNDNSRIVTAKMESLIISLYCLPTKPYISEVHNLYLQFLGGAIEVIDRKSGEVFNNKDFYEDEQPIIVSEATIWNYLKDPKNELIIKKYRNGSYDFNHKQRPHHHRHAPNFSMSKITLDDRDIYHSKLPNGKRVKAYYAFDDASTALIGIAHSQSKTHELYLDCIRNMFQFLFNHNIGIPLQMEVEHHLVRDFSEGLMKAGNIFPFVRWCNPTNSQEKYAENRIKAKKYGVEKRNNQNVGRFYLKNDSNRTTMQKIFDADNDNYKEPIKDYKEIVANELQEQIAYNNELHPNQKKYKGMTRMDVFLYHLNPDLPKINKSILAKYIGYKTTTSIRRSQYVRVQHGKYQLASPDVLRFLKPNDYKVDAYYIPNDKNEIGEVYIYQNEVFISTCKPIEEYNRANAEWTSADEEKYLNATKYVSTFDKMVKEDTAEKIQPVVVIKTDKSNLNTVETEVLNDVNTVETDYQLEELNQDYERNRAISSL